MSTQDPKIRWTVTEIQESVCVDSFDGMDEIALVYGVTQEVRRKRAALIAAAPEMLAALKFIEEFAEVEHGGALTPTQNLLNLIARAEGR